MLILTNSKLIAELKYIKNCTISVISTLTVFPLTSNVGIRCGNIPNVKMPNTHNRKLSTPILLFLKIDFQARPPAFELNAQMNHVLSLYALQKYKNTK